MLQLQYQSAEPFDVLQPYVFQMGPVDFYRQYIKAYPESESRRTILRGFRHYLRDLDKLGALVAVIVDGSFVTKKPNPGDIDISLFYDVESVNSMKPEEYTLLNNLSNDSILCQEANKRKYHTHPYHCVPIWHKPTEELTDISKDFTEKALSFWSGSRDNKTTKGVIIIVFRREEAEQLEALISWDPCCNSCPCRRARYGR